MELNLTCSSCNKAFDSCEFSYFCRSCTGSQITKRVCLGLKRSKSEGDSQQKSSERVLSADCTNVSSNDATNFVDLTSDCSTVLIGEEDKFRVNSETTFCCFLCNQKVDSAEPTLKSHLEACLCRYEESLISSALAEDRGDSEWKSFRLTQSCENAGLRSPHFICVVCDEDLSKRSLTSRCLHLKSCARQHNISTKLLLQLICPIDENVDVEELSDSEAVECQVQENSSKKEVPNVWDILMGASKKQSQLQAQKQKFEMERTSEKTTSRNPSWGRIGSFAPKAGSAPKYKLVREGRMTMPIVVDGFQYASTQLSDCYFLTHFHSDHYGGLDKDFSSGKIYCSPTTAGLVRLRLGIRGDSVVPLAMNLEHVLFVGGEEVKVALLDANHCPGAVCLLFEFPNSKKVLHTGDFRWTSELLSNVPKYRHLSELKNNPQNLIVYLDTTYCHPSHCFPSQNEMVEAVVACVRNEIALQRNTLFVFGAYGIGKERLYMAVARDLGCKVYVDKARWRGMMCFDWPASDQALLTTDQSATRLWVAPMNRVNFNSLDSLKSKCTGCTRVVGFLPTGWSMTSNQRRQEKHPVVFGLDGQLQRSSYEPHELLRQRCRGSSVIYSIPYSEHSSFPELVDFIRTFRPAKVIPTVNTSQENVKSQLDLLLQGCKDVS